MNTSSKELKDLASRPSYILLRVRCTMRSILDASLFASPTPSRTYPYFEACSRCAEASEYNSSTPSSLIWPAIIAHFAFLWLFRRGFSWLSCYLNPLVTLARALYEDGALVFSPQLISPSIEFLKEYACSYSTSYPFSDILISGPMVTSCHFK
jgi:hypothetical protein